MRSKWWKWLQLVLIGVLAVLLVISRAQVNASRLVVHNMEDALWRTTVLSLHRVWSGLQQGDGIGVRDAREAAHWLQQVKPYSALTERGSFTRNVGNAMEEFLAVFVAT